MLYQIACNALCGCIFKPQDKEIRDKLDTIPVFLITNGEGQLVAIGSGNDELAAYAFLAHDVADAVRFNLQKQQPAGGKPLAVAFAPLGTVWESLAAAPSTVKRRRPQIRYVASLRTCLIKQRFSCTPNDSSKRHFRLALACRHCLPRAGPPFPGIPARRAKSCGSWPTTLTSRPRAKFRPKSAL